MTAEELFDRSGDLGRCELIEGELIRMSPAGHNHGVITNRIAFHLTRHVLDHDLGEVSSAETGFVLRRNPDTVREADVAFVRAARLGDEPPIGFFDGAPDLAVEVLSPTDRASEVGEKVDLWIAAGAQQVWVADPKRETVTVFNDPGHARVYRRGDTIDGGSLLPGLTLAVADLFR